MSVFHCGWQRRISNDENKKGFLISFWDRNLLSACHMAESLIQKLLINRVQNEQEKNCFARKSDDIRCHVNRKNWFPMFFIPFVPSLLPFFGLSMFHSQLLSSPKIGTECKWIVNIACRLLTTYVLEKSNFLSFSMQHGRNLSNSRHRHFSLLIFTVSQFLKWDVLLSCYESVFDVYCADDWKDGQSGR